MLHLLRIDETGCNVTKTVIPAKAGIQFELQEPMDSRLHGNDEIENRGVAHFWNAQ
jgi:hypothetical protein